MMDLFRKYRKVIYWIIILLVGVPFVFITTDYVPFADRARRAMQADEYRPVAQIGDAVISQEELRRELDRMTPPNPDGTPTDYAALVESGQVDETLTNLIKVRLMQLEAQKVDLDFNREYLQELLKEDPSFRNEQGKFDPELWNEFVRDGRRRGMDWEGIYAQLADNMRYTVAVQRVLASARVRESELREQFERRNTKVRVKYLPLEPKIEPTEEQIQAHYEANKSNYDIPAKRKAEFVAVSNEAPKPEILDDFVAQAREGRDLTEIAKAAPEGLNVQAQPAGPWIALGDATPEQSVLFYMQVGEVSEPVEVPGGYAVYRLEETRLNPETGEFEVRAGQLVAFPTLTETERAARDDQLRSIARSAQDGDLAAAAAQAGLSVQTTDLFSMDASEVQNVPQEDAAMFVQGLADVELDKVSDVIRGQKNLYIAKVVELVPAEPQPLEAVRDRVTQDFIAQTKQSPEYKAQIEQLAREIPQKVQTLEEAKAAYPDATGELKEAGPFSPGTYSFQDGPFWNPEDVVEQAVKAGEGKIAGPIGDFLGGQYLVQLVEKTVPDEKAWQEEFPKEKDNLRRSLLTRRQNERFADYLDYLLMNANINIARNDAAILRALNLDRPDEEEQPGAAEAATAPATTEPAPAGS